MKKNKGITLIALIITIIILLILVGVSINLAIKGDLFGSAQKAVSGTNAKVDEQQTRVDELMGELEQIKSQNQDEVHDWTRTGDNLECKHCNVKLTIGQEIDYTDNGKGSSSISAEKAGGYVGNGTTGKLNNSVKIASLKSGISFKIAAAPEVSVVDNQPKTTQTISKDANTKWVVLGIENTDKDANGTNETLLITTKTPTTGTIKLYGAAGYNNCIEEINRMCKELYGEEARGITIEDVNNCLQYTPEGATYYDKDGDTLTTNNLTTKLSELHARVWSVISSNNETPDGQELGEFLLNGYEYNASGNAKSTDKEKEVIFGSTNGNRYWLASRGVCAYGMDRCAYFGPGYVRESVVDSYSYLFNSSGNETVSEFSLRAVVPLRSNIPGIVE